MKTANEIHLKFVDDLTLAESINLPDKLVKVPDEQRAQPDNHHARTGHVLEPEESRVYKQLMKTQRYAIENGMKINPKKTKLILFNPSKNIDFIPNFLDLKTNRA